MIPAASLPDCPKCGTTIRQAERIGVSAAVEPCGHFIPAEFFKPGHVEAGVQQELVADGGQVEERHCTTCGKSVDDAPYGRWLFGTCSSCAAEPAPSRWSAGMAPGTAVKWAYTPRWHIDEHPESNHHIVADGGVVREDLSSFGGGVDHGPHVSLMDCMAAVRAAGIDEPPLADPIRSWREFGVEIKERVFRTTLYAVRRACPDAPAAPPAEPPETVTRSKWFRTMTQSNRRWAISWEVSRRDALCRLRGSPSGRLGAGLRSRTRARRRGRHRAVCSLFHLETLEQTVHADRRSGSVSDRPLGAWSRMIGGPSRDRETFPSLKDEIGEDPARYLDVDRVSDLELARARIRGIDFIAVIRAWKAVERNLAANGVVSEHHRSTVMAWLDEREAELEEIGERDDRVEPGSRTPSPAAEFTWVDCEGGERPTSTVDADQYRDATDGGEDA